MRSLHVIHQLRVTPTQLGTQRAHQTGLTLPRLSLHHLTPAVQHLDLLADNLVPQIILKDRFLVNKVLL